MDMALPLDAREVLFHLNYMGYRNITKEQLKSFMIDLKKLIRFESNPQVGTAAAPASRRPIQAVSHSVNIQRLFEAHSRNNIPNKKKHPERSEATAQKLTNIINNDDHNKENKSTDQQKVAKTTNDKENIPTKNTATNDNLAHQVEPKSKMWIRPKSAQASRSANIKKRTDPVALYQSYQKDWEKFRTNICETSRSELRWQIRERLANQRN